MPKELIHTYQRFGLKLEFYIDDSGRLRAQATKEDETYEILSLEGLPFQQGLLDKEKRAEIKALLENSFFTCIGNTVSVNSRLLGGWGEEIHRGFSAIAQDGKSYTPDKEGVDGTFQWALDSTFPFYLAKPIAEACASIDKGATAPTPDPLLDPREIARAASEKVQRWHFNTNFERAPDYSISDSRIVLAADCIRAAISRLGRNTTERREAFNFAIEYCKLSLEIPKIVLEINYLETCIIECNRKLHSLEPYYGMINGAANYYKAKRELDDLNEYRNTLLRKYIYFKNKVDRLETYFLRLQEAMVMLGRGLHPLQDMYAHTEDFVTRSRWTPQWHGLLGEADEPKYICDERRSFLSTYPSDKEKGYSQRYTDTRIATYLYLSVFLYNVGQKHKPFREILIQSTPENFEQFFRGLINAIASRGVDVPLPKVHDESLSHSRLGMRG